MSERKKIIRCLLEGNHFALIAHMLPDGDSIGSLLGLGRALILAGKKVKMFNPGPVPHIYRFLKGSEEVQCDSFLSGSEVQVIVLDCSDPERLGALKEQVMASEKIINIDHHVTNQRFGHLNYVNFDAAATGEIIYTLLEEARFNLDKDVAEALYVAIATDTGSFKFDNTTADTHRVAAALLGFGLRPAQIAQGVFDERPLVHYLLLHDALAGLEMYSDNKLAVMTLSCDQRLRRGALSEDLDGIVNYSRNIEGVELGILFYADRADEVKVGFRSKNIDVSALAAIFGGGGHAKAAGCRLKGTFEAVKVKVITAAEKTLLASGL